MHPRDIKNISTIIVGDGMDDDRIGLVSAASDILSAFDRKDPEALTDALYDFFTMCDSMPHEEGEQFAGGGFVEALKSPGSQMEQAKKRGERY